ncbi:FtsX-like permease family protein [Luedemannella helvata]|uniref:ABC3 transporter permease C-terminal domain-containing protein n=1 Tax=Luedemannella helvata TaxID=349315 RepID=A0ABP4WDT6_9ACTN
MFGLVLSALVARRAQAVWLLVLTVLAVGAAAAAPWYLSSAVDSVAAADVAASTARERVYIVKGSLRVTPDGPSPLPAAKERIAGLLNLPGTTATVGDHVDGTAKYKDESATLPIAHREQVCEHLVIDGSCPRGADQVIVSEAVAKKLGVDKGARISLTSFRFKQAVPVTIVGIYRPAVLLDPYWVDTDLLDNQGSRSRGRGPGSFSDAAFVDEPALLAGNADRIDMIYHARLPDNLFGRTDGYDLRAELARTRHDLKIADFNPITSADVLANLIARDQNLVRVGVGVAVAQLLLLCWFALFLAVRHTAEERRPDIGLLKLRGAAPWRVWALTAEQSAWPMLIGAVLGWAGGYLAARVLAGLAGGAALPAIGGTPLWLSLAAAGVAAFGALVSAVIAEWRALGSSVTGLLRRVPARRAGWRADIIDLLIAALALAGVYQGWAESGGTRVSALPLLAPGLMALAIGLIVARLLPIVAGRAGRAALRSGRPAFALAALHVARRPGTHRVLAMLVVAVCVLATASLTWFSSRDAWHGRAAQELGASRVLTVTATNATHLLTGTHAADPEGRYAMAVARGSGSVSGRLLAVDSDRLARVALWNDEYGAPSRAEVATALKPSAPPSITLTDGTLVLTAANPVPRSAIDFDNDPGAAGIAAPELEVTVMGAGGATQIITIGPIKGGTRTYPFTLTGCPADRPCRLVSVEVDGPVRAAVSLHRLDGPGGVLITPDAFGDVARWRGSVVPAGGGVELEAGHGVLTITNGFPAGEQRQVDRRVFVADAVVPLPVVRAGRAPAADPLGDNRISPLGVDDVPYRIARTADVLPGFGADAVLVDLTAAARTSTAVAEAVAYEVWLTDDAPEALTARLADAGLNVINQRTVDEAAGRYARQGPAAALRYLVFTALVGLALAAGSLFVVAAVERRPRAGELAALRAQGVPHRVVRLAGYASYGALVGGAVLAGLLSAILARLIVEAAAPVFTDGWSVLPIRTGAEPVPLLIAAAVAVVVLVGATAVATAQMIRTVRVWQPGGRS